MTEILIGYLVGSSTRSGSTNWIHLLTRSGSSYWVQLPLILFLKMAIHGLFFFIFVFSIVEILGTTTAHLPLILY